MDKPKKMASVFIDGQNEDGYSTPYCLGWNACHDAFTAWEKEVVGMDSREELINKIGEIVPMCLDNAEDIADFIIQDRKKREVSVEEIESIIGNYVQWSAIDDVHCINTLGIKEASKAIVAKLKGE